MKNYIIILFLFVGSSYFSQVEGKSLESKINNLDQYLEQAIKDWNIPGAAIAIVKNGEVILEKGYGIKDASKNNKVDKNTLFAIASNTKAYTTAALARLIDQGELSWDDKVREHLPYFELYDECVSSEITIEDLVCHRSGLKTFSGDLLWYGSDYSREEVIKRAKHLEPTFDFRTDYGYQNIMFITAGEVVAKVSGMKWEDYIKTEFFDKLGMKNTLCSVKDFDEKTNKSEPHNENNGKNSAIDWVNWDNIGGAGAIISSAHDAGKWLNLQLNKGTWNGIEFWKEDQSNKMWTIHTPKKLSNWHRRNFPSKHFSGYGLGWDLYDYHGKLIINHGGGYDGFISHTVLVPEEKLGMIIMVNGNSSLPYAMMYQMLDEFISPDDYEKKDWGKMFLEYKKNGLEDDKKNLIKIIEAREIGTKPSLPIHKYAGKYEDKMYGGLTIGAREGILYFQFDHSPIFKGTLEHWQDDTFRLHWGTKMMLPPGMAHFTMNDLGGIKNLIIDVPNPDFDFTEFTFIPK